MSKLADDRYTVVATDTAHRHVEAWLRRHLPLPLPGAAAPQVRTVREKDEPEPSSQSYPPPRRCLSTTSPAPTRS